MLSREVQLAVVPDGLPRPEHFVVVRRPIPVAGPGEVLVRNRFFQVSARLRTLLSETEADTPLPLVRPGDSLPSATIGEVVTAPDDSGLRPGELVFHWSGWREYAVVPVAMCTPVGDALPDPVAHLGSGWTAYAALTRSAQLRPGETVLVTGGTGGVGSLAGQIARKLGAARVIGTTGSAAKADRMRSELGYDTVLVRGHEPIAAQLSRLVPDGVDVVVDNVGGEQLAAAIESARSGARLVLVGTLAGQLAPSSSGATAPVELDTYRIILKGLRLHGFADRGEPAAHAEWLATFGGWLRAGDITFPHVRVPGIDNAARTLHEVIGGHHVGTAVVELERGPDEDR
ncbi:MAG TPA: zinc-binding dehydrogenase [Pseudonocardiaceae bacterium]|nr:zinc-binding dehydrogenase [Pseudonocardiaceae bacterium]